MFIYKITNKINGKIYIGQTINAPKKRWQSHCNLKGKKSVITNAICKYGKENFTFEEIDGANSQCELDYREWLLVHKFNSLAPNGYNVNYGGKGGCKFTADTRARISLSHMGKKQSPETIEKRRKATTGLKRKPEFSAFMSKLHKGKKLSKEHKAIISKNQTGRPVSKETRDKIGLFNKGKTVSPETRKLISKAHMGIKLSPEHVNSLKKAWETRDPVSDETRAKQSKTWHDTGRTISPEHRAKINKSLEGQRGVKRSKECCAKMSKAAKNRSKEARANQSAAAKRRHDLNAKAVMCIETSEVYISPARAAEAVGLVRSYSIVECCKGKRERTGGYTWKYA